MWALDPAERQKAVLLLVWPGGSANRGELAGREALAGIFLTSGCERLSEGSFTLPGGAEPDAALRALAASSASAGAALWLLVKLPADQGRAEPYARLRDRTDTHAEVIAAWRSAKGRLPPLQPGELIRVSGS